ncbi:hypothetical protein D3C72_1996440 [compost metagenome]
MGLKQDVLLANDLLGLTLGSDIAKNQHDTTHEARRITDGGRTIGNRTLSAITGNERSMIG